MAQLLMDLEEDDAAGLVVAGELRQLGGRP
jgi:hypothetical protein